MEDSHRVARYLPRECRSVLQKELVQSHSVFTRSDFTSRVRSTDDVDIKQNFGGYKFWRELKIGGACANRQTAKLNSPPNFPACGIIGTSLSGPSLFGGLDSELDCGTGLRDWTDRKLRSSDFEAAHTLLHYSALTSHELN